MSTKYFFFGRIQKSEEEEHRRGTRSESFHLEGGSKEEHDQLTERAIKLDERLKKSKHPDEVTEIIEQTFGDME